MSRLAPPLHLRNETELERCDRHLAELMQEVRVVQTGVQVLFGFLLTVPFTVRFDALTAGQVRLFFSTLALAGVAAMLLITPSAQHRILFRCGDKPCRIDDELDHGNWSRRARLEIDAEVGVERIKRKIAAVVR